MKTNSWTTAGQAKDISPSHNPLVKVLRRGRHWVWGPNRRRAIKEWSIAIKVSPLLNRHHYDAPIRYWFIITMKRQSVIESPLLWCYIRQSSYCFYIAVNRICVTISRVDGALKPWSAIYLRVGNSKQNLHIWICLFQLCKVCFGSWGGGNHYYDSTAQTAMQ